MDFFVYSRDAAGVAALRDDAELLERHWTYMDGFAESMIARGPTLGSSRETATGSLHILGLPSVNAARDFVADEPNNRAGVYLEHSVWRFGNLLGRTMWEFSNPGDDPRFLIVARLQHDQRNDRSVRAIPFEDLSAPLRKQLIVYGALSTLDDARLIGVTLAVQARHRAAVDALLAEEHALDVFGDLEIHDWEFGGRR
jgi:uncharacterized protein YciI